MTKLEVYQSLAAGQLSPEDAEKLIQAIEEENNNPVVFKVSKKKCLVINGIRKKFPISLYPKEIVKLFDNSQRILEFLEEKKEEFAEAV